MCIKEVIKERGFTLEQVGKALGKSKSGISHIVNNENTPPNTLRKIASVIGCDVVEFFRDEATSHANPSELTCPHCGKPVKVVISTP